MLLAYTYFFTTITCTCAQFSSRSWASAHTVATHTVAVGAAGHTFTPNTVIASIADVVEFWFYPLNHSVARAGYQYPCIPYEYTGVNKVGFWSGFRPVNVVLQSPPQFSITVNDTEPIFFYCSAPGSCIQEGMIGVINPNQTQTLATQLAYGKNSTLSFSPGEAYPSELSASSTGSAAPSSLPTSSATLSSGAIAGIVLGSIAIIALTITIFLLFKRRRGRQDPNGPQKSETHFSPSTVQQRLDIYDPGYPLPPNPVEQSPEPRGRLLSPQNSPEVNKFSLILQDNVRPSSHIEYHNSLQPAGAYSNQQVSETPQELESVQVLSPFSPYSFDDKVGPYRDEWARKFKSM